MWLRLRQICLVTNNLEAVVASLESIFGLEVCYIDEAVGKYGLVNRLFPIGSQFLELVAPVEENTAAGRFIERRKGDGGYMVITQCDDLAPRRKRAAERRSGDRSGARRQIGRIGESSHVIRVK